MKRLHIIIAALALLFTSCQVINTDDRYLDYSVKGSDRVVLLMDFTGWKCTNCPEAASIANSLLEAYPENLIVVSMHPEGHFFTDPGTSGPDFASSEAMEYFQAFGGTASSSLPTGVVDMKKTNGDYFIDRSKWATAVTDRMQVSSQYSIGMNLVTEDSYEISFSCVTGDPCANVSLLVWLIEDSIVAPQLGASNEYTHRHVFRKCLTDNLWGEQFLNMKKGETLSLNGSIDLPGLQGQHFGVVAVLINTETHEVLQCAEAMIRDVEPEKPAFGMFTLSLDSLGAQPINDGDTITVTEFDPSAGEMLFHGFIHAGNDSLVSFYIDEDRDFDGSEYHVSMCVYTCIPDAENKGKWGPFTLNPGIDQSFSSHIAIPYEELGDSHNFTTRFTFRNNDVSYSFVVHYNYTPTN